jgi:hypothetical protein
MSVPDELPPNTNISPETAGQFFSPMLWNMPQQGELRPITAIFIALPQMLPLDEVHNWISQLIETVDQFGGHYAETYFGDRECLALVYFGAPTAQENDTGRALQFLLNLRDLWTDRPITWRAGVTTGPAYTGYIGIPLRGEYKALGSIVNMAARLTEQADWGQILVSEAVACWPGFQFSGRGEYSLKGFAQPVPVFALQARGQLEPAFYREPLIGREAELDLLRQFAQPLAEHRFAGLVSIYGEPGMGKSHLAYALQQALPSEISRFTAPTGPHSPGGLFALRQLAQTLL